MKLTTKRAVMAIGLTFLLCGAASQEGCSEQHEAQNRAADMDSNSFGQEQRKTESNQQTLLAQQPPPKLRWSLERDNLIKRTTMWNQPNKVSYIYLLGKNGGVVAFYPIKGKVTSVNSALTNPQQIVLSSAYGHYESHVVDSPAEDGSYGTNGSAVFFFTTDGTYVEWNGEYLLADKPLKVSTPPVLVRGID
jgi:hypothetical protein